MKNSAMQPGETRFGYARFTGTNDELLPCRLHFTGRYPELVFIYPRQGRLEGIFRRWESSPPASIVYFDLEGVVAMAGFTLSSSRSGRLLEQAIQPDLLIYGEPISQESDYKAQTFMSTIDHIESLDDANSVNVEYPAPGEASHYTIRVDPSEPIAWEHNGFRHSIRSEIISRDEIGRSGRGRSFIISRETRLVSESERGSSCLEFISSQLPIRQLLTLCTGYRSNWRSHRWTSDQFPLLSNANTIQGSQVVDVQHFSTIREHTRPESMFDNLGLVKRFMTSIGSQGVKDWYEKLDDPLYNRAVREAAAGLPGSNGPIESDILLLCIALESFATHAAGKKVSTRDVFEHCLEAAKPLNIEASRGGLIDFLSGVYNNIKHRERNGTQSADELELAYSLLRAIVKGQLFTVFDAIKELSNLIFYSMEGQVLLNMIRSGEFYSEPATRVSGVDLEHKRWRKKN